MSVHDTDDHAPALKELLDVIESLLAPDGCPWDKEQTPQSMCDYLAEETFELIEGIRCNDDKEAMEEMGDVLFIILFMAVKYQQAGAFSLSDALRSNVAKMVRRHPHVFSDTCFEDRQALLDNWENTKKQENKGTDRKRVFDSLPKGLPSLLKAYRINSKAARNRFTWKNTEDVAGQLNEEWAEWKEAEAAGDASAMEQEFGDYLFTLVELGRRHGIKANSALSSANQKFLDRFARMEDLAQERGQTFDDLDHDAKNTLWNEVKKNES